MKTKKIIVESHKKKEPDITLTFKDNANGFRNTFESSFSEGFDMELYFADKISAFSQRARRYYEDKN